MRFKGFRSQGASAGQQRSDEIGGRAAATIVSRNYIPAARILCRSFLAHHPDARFFVLLVDQPERDETFEREPFEIVRLEELGIMNLEGFMAQYSILEANTAVKPYLLEHLFRTALPEKLLYLDPDIKLFGELSAIWSALDDHDVVLIPHLREPFSDNTFPGELDILRSGTYNLGFVGLRNGVESQRLLRWWKEKTEHDCVVDIPQGLFVDQKWMDLIPGYCRAVHVLRDPEYNVAYWNLHERKLEKRGPEFRVDDRALKFFHFSGYDPQRPSKLSKYQNRHMLEDMPAVRQLCEDYRRELYTEGYDVFRQKPYAYDWLPNGIRMSQEMRRIVRRCLKEEIPFPSVRNADAFCEFLMTPNAAFSGREIPPLFHAILSNRVDVVTAFPGAQQDARDSGFSHWLRTTGADEHHCRELCERFGHCVTRTNPFVRMKELYDARSDVQSVVPDAFSTAEGLEAYGHWLDQYGVVEESLRRQDIEEFLQAGKVAFPKVVDLYLGSPALHRMFPLALLSDADDFCQFLIRRGHAVGKITSTEAYWFRERLAQEDPSLLLLVTAQHNWWVRLQFPLGATMMGWDALRGWASAHATAKGEKLPAISPHLPARVPITNQLEAASTTARYAAPTAFHSPPALLRLADDIDSDFDTSLRTQDRTAIEHAAVDYRPRAGINVSGYFTYRAGMGESARSMLRTLDATQIAHRDLNLPSAPSALCEYRLASESAERLAPWLDTHDADFRTSLTIANADAVGIARAFLPDTFYAGRRNIAYWVWETERLPAKFADAAIGFDEIWTPTEYSASAIRATISGIPVHVVPHSLGDVNSAPAPHSIPLPDDHVIFGFFFDMRSVVQRKNPDALLEAFRKAFRPSEKVSLVLKVNHASEYVRDFKRLQAKAAGLNIVWIQDRRLDAAEMEGLFRRIDVYVSLHRAEGFGLTLAEAMLRRKPVIATGYSGNVDFMNDSCARLVKYEIVETDRAYSPYPRGTRWADPNVEHAASLMRSLFQNPGLRQELGNRAKQHVLAKLSPAVVGRRVRALVFPEEQPAATTSATHSAALPAAE